MREQHPLRRENEKLEPKGAGKVLGLHGAHGEWAGVVPLMPQMRRMRPLLSFLGHQVTSGQSREHPGGSLPFGSQGVWWGEG